MQYVGSRNNTPYYSLLLTMQRFSPVADRFLNIACLVYTFPHKTHSIDKWLF